MAWSEQWSYKVSGLELNDIDNYTCVVPEISNAFPIEHVLVAIAGGYPVFHRSQVLSGKFTFLIHVRRPTHADFNTRMAALHAAFADGALTFEVQARGMPSAKSVTIYRDSVMVDEYRVGRLAITATAPNPTLV